MINRFFEYKNYENSYIVDEILTNVANYLESIQPISKKDGFITCLFESTDSNIFLFEISTDMDEDNFEKLYNFIEKEKIEYKDSKYNVFDNMNNMWIDEIYFELSDKQIDYYNEIYTSVDKYNL